MERQPQAGDQILFTANSHVKPNLYQISRVEIHAKIPRIVIVRSLYDETEHIMDIAWDEKNSCWVSKRAQQHRQFYPSEYPN